MLISEPILSEFFAKLQQAVSEGYVLKRVSFSSERYKASLSPAKPVRRIVRARPKKKRQPGRKPAPAWKRSPHLVPREVAMSSKRAYAYYYESIKGDLFPVIWYPKRERRRHYIRRMYTGAEHGGMWYEKTGHSLKTGKFDMKEYGITWRLWADWPDKEERQKAEWKKIMSDNPTLVEKTACTTRPEQIESMELEECQNG